MRKIELLFLLSFLFYSLLIAQEKDFKHEKESLAHIELSNYSKIQTANLQQTENQSNYNVAYYDINLEIIPLTTSIIGHVGIIAKVVNNPISDFEVNLLYNMIVDSINISDKAVNFVHSEDIVSISLDRTYNPGEQVSVRIFYHGRPMSVGFGAFGFNYFDGQSMIWSLSEPFGARNWWPCKDIPSDKADSVDIRVTVPQHLVVVSNGLLRSETAKNYKKTYWWHEKYPITTYLISLAIHPYSKFSDSLEVVPGKKMPIDYYVFPSELNDAQIAYSKTKDMLQIFSELFGPYPFHEEKYGHAQFVGGANMEHQTISSLRTYNEYTIAHELAHQWWGDMITCHDFGHIWLNEGFATYSEALWAEFYYGEDAYWDDILINKYFGGGTIFVTQMDVSTIFNYGRSYQKGSWVLHMLRHVVGDSDFFQILKAYGSSPKHKYGTATTEEFQQICEQVTGKDLNDFFQQWIYGEFYPVYAYNFTSKDSSGYYATKVTIHQKQTNTGFFNMPIDLYFELNNSDTTIVVENFLKEQSYHFVFDQKPVRMKLDPEGWILKGIIDLSATVSYPEAFEILGQYPNPFKTNSNFDLTIHKRASVSVEVFNILGQKIKTLFRGTLSTGPYNFTWNGDDESNKDVPPGIYFYRVNHPELRKSIKILKVR